MWNTRVFYHLAVTQDILLEYTCPADAGIIPYLAQDKGAYYCTPNKMFEFMVAGLPILASDMPELKRFISGQGIGLNRKMIDHLDIAAALNDFFDMDWHGFGNRSQMIAGRFIWATLAAVVRSVYDSLDAPAINGQLALLPRLAKSGNACRKARQPR